MKKIILNNKQFNSLINESQFINEFYDISRKDYKNNLESLLPLILIHIYLIKYSKTSNLNTETISHWLSEIESWCAKLKNYTLKTNKNSEIKYKVFDEVYSSINQKRLQKYILMKCEKENFTNYDLIVRIINEIDQNINYVKEFISNDKFNDFSKIINLI